MTGVVNEPVRNLPVAGRADVIVCGAGLAGLAAAVAAGRKGMKAVLIETRGCLGAI